MIFEPISLWPLNQIAHNKLVDMRTYHFSPRKSFFRNSLVFAMKFITTKKGLNFATKAWRGICIGV